MFAPASVHATFASTIVRCGHGSWTQNEDGLWVSDPDGKALDSMEESDRKQIERSVRVNIDGSPVFYSLNGLTARVIQSLGSGSDNSLDGCLVVVDEAHNLSRTLARGTRDAPMALYNKLRSARRCKVMLMTGTPIQNHPVELAFLVNMASGDVREHVIRWSRPISGDALDAARSVVSSIPYVSDVYANSLFVTFRVTPPGFELEGGRLISSGSRLPNVDESHDERARVRNVFVEISRAVACHMSNPRIREVLPTDAGVFEHMFVCPDTNFVRNASLLMHLLSGTVSAFSPDTEDSRYPRVAAREEVRVPMSKHQVDQYFKVRRHEIEVGAKSPDISIFRFYSRAVSNFAFPRGKRGLRQFKFQRAREDNSEYSEYVARIVKSLKGSSLWRNVSKLRDVSPKFARVLESVERSQDKSMVYSAFRTVEGVGLFSFMLRERGWRELVLRGGAIEVEPVDGRGPLYVSPDSSKSTDLVHIFNGRPERASEKVRAAWKRMSGPLDIRVILLSKAGAEGINLEAVRFVHLLEPQWSASDVEQILGRAVRLDSHATLPENRRDVRLYTYIATVPTEYASAAPPTDVMGEEGVVKSTDEAVLAVSAKKQAVANSFMAVVQQSSVDCSFGGYSGCQYRKSRSSAVGDREPVLLSLDGRQIVRVGNGAGDLFDARAWQSDGIAVPVGRVDEEGSVSWS